MTVTENMFRYCADVSMFDKPGSIRFVNSDRDALLYLPAEKANRNPVTLQQYAAIFHSDETVSDLGIVVENNKKRVLPLKVWVVPFTLKERKPKNLLQ